MDTVAMEYAEFDPSFLQYTQGKTTLDIHRFNQGNPTPAGKYYADVYLNNKWKGLCLSVSYAICHINIFGVYT